MILLKNFLTLMKMIWKNFLKTSMNCINSNIYFHSFLLFTILNGFVRQELVSTQEEALQIFEKVDILMEGTSKEHELAFALLTSYENEVQC